MFKKKYSRKKSFMSFIFTLSKKMASVFCIAGLLIVTNFPFLNAFEAHVINVTAKISNYPVVLNEFLPNPIGCDSSSGADGEWVELYNTNNERSYDVEGWTLTDNSGHQLVISGCYTNTGDTVVPPLGFLVVYRKAVGCTSSFSLNNDGDTVNLYTGDPAGAVLIDTYTYSYADYCELKPTPGEENNDTRSGDCSGEIPENKSYARIPDGVGDWVDPVPTPGAPNKADENVDGGEMNVGPNVGGGGVFEADVYNFDVSSADSEDDNFSAVNDRDISPAGNENLGDNIDTTDDLDNVVADDTTDNNGDEEFKEETIDLKEENNIAGEAVAGDNNGDDSNDNDGDNDSDIAEDVGEPEVKEAAADDDLTVDLPAEDSADAGIINNELDKTEMEEKIFEDNLAENPAVDLSDEEDVGADSVDSQLEDDVLGSNDLDEESDIPEKEDSDVLEETILDGQQEDIGNEEEIILDDLEVEDQQPVDGEMKEIKEKIDEENVDVDNIDNGQDEDNDNDNDNDDGWPIKNDDSAEIEFNL